MDYLYILAPLGLGVILTLCSTAYCIYIHYSKRRLVERIKKAMLAKTVGKTSDVAANTEWYTKVGTDKKNSVVAYPNVLSHIPSIPVPQMKFYCHPGQSRTDIFVQKVGNEVYSSLTKEASHVRKIPYQDGRYITPYGASSIKSQDGNLRDCSFVEGIYVNYPVRPSNVTHVQNELRKYINETKVTTFCRVLTYSMLIYSENKPYQEHLNKCSNSIHEERNDRKNFYIKVLTVFLLQLFILYLVFFTFNYIPILNLWIGQHIWSMYLLCLTNGYNAIILLKVSTIERLYPINVIILSIFTIFHSSILATITYQNGAYDDVVSFFIVLLTSIILFLITMKYSFDITIIFYEYFYAFTVPLIFTPILMVIFAITGYEIVFTKMFMAFTFIHFQFFTIITVQTLQGGHDVEVEIEDYVLGAMQMFIVILCSSLSLLTLFDNNSNEVYIWYKTIFLLFNIPLVYFAILVNEINLKGKLKNNSK
ncbi:hypothetical protein MN116_002421 [Schistosoma mekongi]|uniref:Uncharacterized protein n=1 Tax=Schistosoma mekongi TaxID=38744 RepID=A0AAE2D8E3_SCHME|nr:hypothetical protein MN116_002421 [Schistosoma mekongi]